MMLARLLADIISAESISMQAVQFDAFKNIAVQAITDDSRRVESGSLFLAYPGLRTDGRQYISQAIRQGAIAVLYESDALSAKDQANIQALHALSKYDVIPIIPVKQLQAMQGVVASRFYGAPSNHMTVVGITGTNGKTSCSHYLAQALQYLNAKKRCAVVGTLGNGFLESLQQDAYTTQDAISLQQNLAQLLQQGAATVAMEVSSHSLAQHRVAGVQFDIAVLTQLSQDHLDYHGSMEAYAQAKSQLFVQPGLRYRVLNADDALGQQHIKRFSAKHHVIAYSCHAITDVGVPLVFAKNISVTSRGFQLDLHTPWGQAELQLPLLGEFNISNALAVIAVLGAMQHSLPAIVKAISNLSSVKGRMQQFVTSGQPSVIVDYAHTPDALAQALKTLHAHHPKHIWCVFGCGGDRDQGKRALMGEYAEQFSDHVVITNDNPRSESPDQIIQDICTGLKKPQQPIIEPDRAKAIAYAITHADPNDIVLIAGKGHEQVQIIGDQRLPFSDQQHVQKILSKGIKP